MRVMAVKNVIHEHQLFYYSFSSTLFSPFMIAPLTTEINGTLHDRPHVQRRLINVQVIAPNGSQSVFLGLAHTHLPICSFHKTHVCAHMYITWFTHINHPCATHIVPTVEHYLASLSLITLIFPCQAHINIQMGPNHGYPTLTCQFVAQMQPTLDISGNAKS